MDVATLHVGVSVLQVFVFVNLFVVKNFFLMPLIGIAFRCLYAQPWECRMPVVILQLGKFICRKSAIVFLPKSSVFNFVCVCVWGGGGHK